jgi:hypothetical protein
MMLAATFSISLAAWAADDIQGFSFSGHLDYYYMADFAKPSTAAGTNLRQFDLLQNQFGFAAFEVDALKKPTATNPFGITANFLIGKNADIIAAAEPAGQNSSKLIQQLFVTYAVPKSDATVDFGKFLTWVGYEGVDATADDQYSRSFLFTLGQPIYHTGLRGSTTIFKNVTGSLYLVNGWNEVQDSNGGKSYGATIGLTPTSKSTVTFNYYGGQEGSDAISGIGFTSAGARGVNMGDFIATYQLSAKTKLAVNADYADAKGFDGSSGGKWSGVAAYVTHTLTDKWTLAARGETFSDPDGLRVAGGGRFNSLTGTLSYNSSKDSQFRLEVRYDKSNVAAFNADNGSMKDNRTTLTFSHVLKF